MGPEAVLLLDKLQPARHELHASEVAHTKLIVLDRILEDFAENCILAHILVLEAELAQAHELLKAARGTGVALITDELELRGPLRGQSFTADSSSDRAVVKMSRCCLPMPRPWAARSSPTR